MEDLARTVTIILFFPVVASPLVFLITWKWERKWLTILSIPVSIVSATLGLFLLLSEIGTAARAFGLWGLLFALATWRLILRRMRQKPDGH